MLNRLIKPVMAVSAKSVSVKPGQIALQVVLVFATSSDGTTSPSTPCLAAVYAGTGVSLSEAVEAIAIDAMGADQIAALAERR